MATILVVDDSPLLRRLVNHILSKRGYRVLEASNGKEAFYLLKKEKPDLILLDIMMPEMDGPSFMREFRRYDEYKNIPVLVLTAVGERSMIDEMKSLGVVDFLFKPFSPVKLETIVKRLLKGLKDAGGE
ncbi:MAG: response regulator [Synergistetes bacterium]|nr:response regulator [Synergistota bacterium]